MSEREVDAFVDRVMSAIETVPAPTPVRAFGWSLRAGAWRDTVSSLLVAWHLGTVRGWSVAPPVRARSMALVLAVVSVLTTGSLVAAAAVHVAVSDDDRVPPALTGGAPTSSAPMMDDRGVDDSTQDWVQPSSVPAIVPGPAAAEPSVLPTAAPDRVRKHPPGDAARTTGGREDGSDEPEATDPRGGSDATDRSDAGGDTESRDGSGDSGHDGTGTDDTHDGGTGGGTDGGGED